MRNFSCLPLGSILAWLIAAPAPAQIVQIDAVARTRPILRPAAEAPLAPIRQVKFSGDARQGWLLYSAGDDKLVRKWLLVPQSAGGVALQGSGNVSWPIFRAIRGVIYALDVQSTASGELLAFGGIGTKTPQVNLLLPGQHDKPWLLVDPRVLARHYLVNSLNLNPAGDQLAVGYDQNANVLVWDIAALPPVASALATGLSSVRHVAYNPAGTRLAVAGRTADGGWSVQTWNAKSGVREASQQVAAEVTAVVWANDAIWLAATRAGVAQSGAAAAHAIGDVRSIAPLWDGTGYVVAAFDSARNTTQVAFWDPTAVDLQPYAEGTFIGGEVVLDTSGEPFYVAAGGLVQSPQASVQAPINAVRVWESRTRQLLAQVPDAKAGLSTGAPIAGVAALPGGVNAAGGRRPYTIGIAWGLKQARPATYQTEFKRFNRALAPHTTGVALQVPDRSIRSRGSDRSWYLVKSQTDYWGPLPSWGQRVPICYAEDVPRNQIALGYQDGILVCDRQRLIDGQGDRAILRSFYGHDNEVTCLAFSGDDELLLSGSLDGTISGWSLRGMKAGGNELGVQFGLRRNAAGQGPYMTVLNDPPVDSPAAEAGFKAGQQLNRIQVNGVEVPPNSWSEYLKAPTPGKELLATIVHNGQAKTVQSLISHDPLWTLYPMADANWILWTPEGHFDASPGAMDRLAWHMDLEHDAGREQPKQYASSMVLSAREFREVYFSAELMNDVLRLGKRDAPQVVTVPPRLKIAIEGDQVVLTAQPNGNEPIRELELWLNGYRLARRQGAELSSSKTGPQRLEQKLDRRLLRQAGNTLFAVAAIEVAAKNGRPAGKLYSREILRLSLEAPPAARPPRLHYLGVGVTRLSPGVGLNPLRFAGQDAVALGGALSRSGILEPGFHRVLADYTPEDGKPPQSPSEQAIETALKDLTEAAGPDDLAIVLFSGHGLTTANGFRLVASDTRRPEKSRISDQLINDYLTRLPCRTLLLLDTCHAEDVRLEQQLNDWPGFGLGPLIVASCDAAEESYEHEELRLSGGLQGHGLFTAALLEPLLGGRCEQQIVEKLPACDGNADGQISIDEWCRYASRRTELLSDLSYPFVPAGKKPQHPKILPSFSFQDARQFVVAPAPK